MKRGFCNLKRFNNAKNENSPTFKAFLFYRLGSKKLTGAIYKYFLFIQLVISPS